jgi:hypothetical protein
MKKGGMKKAATEKCSHFASDVTLKEIQAEACPQENSAITCATCFR